MNCLSQLSSYTAAIVGSTARLIANRSLNRCSFPIKSEYRGIGSFHSEFVLTTRCYSTKKGRKSGSSRLHKAQPEAPVMEQEKDAFYVVRKGDVVGIYNSLTDSQAQVGSSVCTPPVSVYKGYSLSKDTEEYLVSHGLKNALYTIRAADLKEDLFGKLVPCPFQEPSSTKEGTSNKNVSKKRSLGVLGHDNEKKVISEDPLRKQVKLDHAAVAVAEVPSHATRTCIIEFDGASKGNPGKAGAGAIVRANDGNLICRLREGVGIATNNAAEYRAMILGMKYALKKGFTGIRIQAGNILLFPLLATIYARDIFGLYQISEEIDPVVYQLDLPPKAKIHDVFLESLLKPHIGPPLSTAQLAIIVDKEPIPRTLQFLNGNGLMILWSKIVGPYPVD
ncbi:hypothetical protein CR513_05279, partial [Mucuna pruriens]